MAKEYKLDIFKLLDKISTKDWKYYRNLGDDEKKEISPYVLMRWLSGTRDPRQVVLLSVAVNPFAYTLQKHKELLLQLMTVATSGRRQRYRWTKLAPRKKSNNKLVDLVKHYFSYSSKEAEEVLPLLDDDTLLAYAEQLGYQIEEIKQLKRDLKKRA